MNRDEIVKKLMESFLKRNPSIEEKKAEVFALRSVAETYKGTEAELLYQDWASSLKEYLIEHDQIDVDHLTSV